MRCGKYLTAKAAHKRHLYGPILDAILRNCGSQTQCSAADCVLIFIGAAACTAPKFCNFTEANMCVLSLVQCAAQHRHQTILMWVSCISRFRLLTVYSVVYSVVARPSSLQQPTNQQYWHSPHSLGSPHSASQPAIIRNITSSTLWEDVNMFCQIIWNKSILFSALSASTQCHCHSLSSPFTLAWRYLASW